MSCPDRGAWGAGRAALGAGRCGSDCGGAYWCGTDGCWDCWDWCGTYCCGTDGCRSVAEFDDEFDGVATSPLERLARNLT
ncbi:hypothetical protein GCM10010442_18460 [Kitasatospora kifunensis]